MESSDERLVAHAQEVTDPLKRIRYLRGVLYEYNDLARSHGFFSTEERLGISAQEVAIVLPQAVEPAPFDLDSDGVSESGEKYMAVRYDLMAPLFVEAIKEQQRCIDSLNTRVDALLADIALLKRRRS
jgi:hypothetical protein